MHAPVYSRNMACLRNAVLVHFAVSIQDWLGAGIRTFVSAFHFLPLALAVYNGATVTSPRPAATSAGWLSGGPSPAFSLGWELGPSALLRASRGVERRLGNPRGKGAEPWLCEGGRQLQENAKYPCAPKTRRRRLLWGKKQSPSANRS